MAQDVIVREEDCGTDDGIAVSTIRQRDDVVETLRERALGRVAAEDVVHPKTGEVIVKAGEEILEEHAKAINLAGIEEVKVRSPLTCRTRHGVCVKCYGRNLATGRMVELGEAVGIVAAQSIGEPGTQLAMGTFHTDGVAGDDITHGLPRVEELFEARKPKGQAIISEVSGVVRIAHGQRARVVLVRTAEGEETGYGIPFGVRLVVADGQRIYAGDQMTEGPLNPHDILRVKGVRAVQDYLVRQVQDVYRSQGVEINDKHIEVVVRQMLRKVRVDDPGDTDLLMGGLVDLFDFEDENRRVLEAGGRPATARPVILGITKASLATDSFLSAASFQETTRVLTEASIKGRTDPLIGLKENIIIGTLIPAGTGMAQHRGVNLVLPKDAQVPSDAKAEEAAEARADTGETRGAEPSEAQDFDSVLRSIFGDGEESGSRSGEAPGKVCTQPSEGAEGVHRASAASAAGAKVESQVGETASSGQRGEKAAPTTETREASSSRILKSAVMAARFYERFLKTRSEEK